MATYGAVDGSPFPFQYEQTTELKRFSTIFGILELMFGIVILLVLSPILLILFLLFLIFACCFRPIGTTFAYRSTLQNETIVTNIIKKVKHYVPPWWYNCHLGAILPFGASPDLLFERVVYTHLDGTHFAVDWYPRAPENAIKDRQEILIALYLPGLGLSSDANVAQVFSKYITENNADICGIVLPRGHPTSQLQWSTIKPWHPSLTTDLKFVLANLEILHSLNRKFCKVFIIGYSASSNIVAMTLSDLSKSHPSYFEQDSSLEIIAAMLVAANYDYRASMSRLESSFIGNIYSRLFVIQFKTFLAYNVHMKDQLTNYDEIMRTQLISEYDALTFQLNGYNSIEDMYDRLCPMNILDNIPVPMITTVGADDPLYLFSHGSVQDGIPRHRYTQNEKIIFIEPSHGNHFGFYDGSFCDMWTNNASYLYPAKLASEFIRTILLLKQGSLQSGQHSFSAITSIDEINVKLDKKTTDLEAITIADGFVEGKNVLRYVDRFESYVNVEDPMKLHHEM